MTDGFVMSSSRPYMLRAMYQWIVDNDCTPYLLVDAGQSGVEVPAQAVKDGKVVLNMAPQATSGMEMGDDDIVFLTRFSGASMRVRVPMAAAQAIYAQETGQGMMFQDEDATLATGPGHGPGPRPALEGISGGADASSNSTPETGAADPSDSSHKPPARGTPHLRVIK